MSGTQVNSSVGASVVEMQIMSNITVYHQMANTLFYFILVPFGFFGNAFTVIVVCLIVKNQTTRRSIPDVLLGTLATIDLLSVIFIHIISMSLTAKDTNMFPQKLCVFQAFGVSMYLKLSFFIQILIASDRYFALVRPLRYHQLSSIKRVRLLLLVLVIVVTFSSTFTVFLSNARARTLNTWYLCVFDWSFQQTSDVVVITTVTALFLTGLFVFIFCNVNLFRILWQYHATRTGSMLRRLSDAMNAMQKERVLPPACTRQISGNDRNLLQTAIEKRKLSTMSARFHLTPTPPGITNAALAGGGIAMTSQPQNLNNSLLLPQISINDAPKAVPPAVKCPSESFLNMTQQNDASDEPVDPLMTSAPPRITSTPPAICVDFERPSDVANGLATDDASVTSSTRNMETAALTRDTDLTTQSSACDDVVAGQSDDDVATRPITLCLSEPRLSIPRCSSSPLVTDENKRLNSSLCSQVTAIRITNTDTGEESNMALDSRRGSKTRRDSQDSRHSDEAADAAVSLLKPARPQRQVSWDSRLPTDEQLQRDRSVSAFSYGQRSLGSAGATRRSLHAARLSEISIHGPYIQRQMQKLVKRLQKKAKDQRKEIILVKLVILYAVIFAATWIPFIILSLLHFSNIYIPDSIGDIGFKLLFGNAILNPIFYGICRKNYRKGYGYIIQTIMNILTCSIVDPPGDDQVFYETRGRRQNQLQGVPRGPPANRVPPRIRLPSEAFLPPQSPPEDSPTKASPPKDFTPSSKLQELFNQYMQDSDGDSGSASSIDYDALALPDIQGEDVFQNLQRVWSTYVNFESCLLDMEEVEHDDEDDIDYDALVDDVFVPAITLQLPEYPDPDMTSRRTLPTLSVNGTAGERKFITQASTTTV